MRSCAPFRCPRLVHFLDGALASNIVIDTSAVATDTVQYVATDPTGLAATSTRTVIIEALAPPPPIVTASSTPETMSSNTATSPVQ